MQHAKIPHNRVDTRDPETLGNFGLNTLSDHRSERDVWRSMVAAQRAHEIDSITGALRDVITSDAQMLGVEPRCLETQIRLHLPSLPRESLTRLKAADAYEMVRTVAIARTSALREARELVEQRAHSSLMLGGEVVLRPDQSIVREDGMRIPLRFGSVRPSVGDYYQARLHYLRSARSDTLLHFGAFLPGTKYPLNYLGFSHCDRAYITDALNTVGLQAQRDEVMVLTRAYALPAAPYNLMSLTVCRAVHAIRAFGRYRFVITAFNPTLGFAGSALRAANFSVFALAPVTYQYNDRGFYVTRRQDSKDLPTETRWPRNVLTALGVDRKSQAALLSNPHIAVIPEESHAMVRSATAKIAEQPTTPRWRDHLEDYRELLEAGWSTKTVHPSYVASRDRARPSRGQCGVSSVWLAAELRAHFGVEATYCYGKLRFDRAGIGEVDHHCWIEIGADTDPHRLVVDLTCDQARGFDQTILCSSYADLLSRGVLYEARSRLGLDDLPADRVWPRYMQLRDAIEAVRSAEEEIAHLPLARTR